MRSSVIWEAYSGFLQGQTRESKEALVAAAVQYHIANGKGQQQNIRAGYDRMLAQVRQGERESGIRLLESLDESYVCALTSLASTIYQAVTKTYTVTFPNLQEANDWLCRQRGMIVTDVNFRTAVTPGLFANHTRAKEIAITYRPWGGDSHTVYGICEEERTRLFLRGKTDDYAAVWEQANPDCKCVAVRSYTNSRGSTSSQLFGFGTDYVEHIKHFVVYRKTVQQA